MSLIVDRESPRHRRRGAELEAVLLDSTWRELLEHGYDGLTYEAVADRAATSRAVLYRRWPAKPALVQAALVRTLGGDRPPVPDTGTLRQDLVETLRQYNSGRMRLGLQLVVRLGSYFEETGSSVVELRELLLGTNASRTDVIFSRAAARGEIDLERMPSRVARLPFDLFRHESLTTLRPVPDAVIDGIVDEVFLPLLAASSGSVERG